MTNLDNAIESALDQFAKEKADLMHPLNKIRLYNAFKSRSPLVVLRSGQKLLLKYNSKTNKVYLRPAKQIGFNEFVPRGTLDLSVVTDVAWIS